MCFNKWNENVQIFASLFFMAICRFDESSIQEDKIVAGISLCLGAHLGK